MAVQTILGSGGAIGVPLARELRKYTDEIRLVSRNPIPVNPGDECLRADLTIKDQLDKAVEGSSIAYLTLGMEYDTDVWERVWPDLMQNLMESCSRHNTKLVFFDNVYMYDRDHLHNMTEQTPVRPTSKKGVVRARISEMLLAASENDEVEALIARSADFLGNKNSILVEMVAKNLSRGKKAFWISDLNKIHSFTYTGDAAKGTAILGNTPEAYGQVWHLPTSGEKLTGKEWITLVAKEMNVNPRFRELPAWLFGIMGLFVPVLKELKEMTYQYDRDYYFNSARFVDHFGFTPVTPQEGVRLTLDQVRL